MENLVFVHDMKSEPYTTSDIVSEYSGVSYKRVRELITRHFNDFEQLGGFRLNGQNLVKVQKVDALIEFII